jgi:tRNA modification GTPase
MRAYVAGRIDLSQAEAVMDVVQAQTPQALAQAHQLLQGWLGTAVSGLRHALLYELAAVIARIDFPDDVDEDVLDVTALQRVTMQIDEYISTARAGVLLRDGAQIALLGRPNVGKSSLLNALLRYDRALVSPIAGTTRDSIEENADIAGIPVRFVDTAGIRVHTPDGVEQMGIGRSRKIAQQADLALVLIDGSQPLNDEDMLVIAARGQAPKLLVITKCDLPTHPDGRAALEPHRSSGQFAAEVTLSTITGTGIDELRQAIASTLQGASPAIDRRISNTRHLDALKRARQAIADAHAGAQRQQAAELIAIDLQDAVTALGEITGEDATEALLDVLFARFCIGK